MPDTPFLTQLRTYLVAQGLVRAPATAGSLPPLWLEPRNGVPAPGEGNNTTERGADLVIGASLATEVRDGEAYADRVLRGTAVRFDIRARLAHMVEAFEQDLRLALVDQFNFFVGTERVQRVELFRPLQRLGSDDQAFDWMTEMIFWRYVPALTV